MLKLVSLTPTYSPYIPPSPCLNHMPLHSRNNSAKIKRSLSSVRAQPFIEYMYKQQLHFLRSEVQSTFCVTLPHKHSKLGFVSTVISLIRQICILQSRIINTMQIWPIIYRIFRIHKFSLLIFSEICIKFYIRIWWVIKTCSQWADIIMTVSTFIDWQISLISHPLWWIMTFNSWQVPIAQNSYDP